MDLPHPEVSPCHDAPGDLHPQRQFTQQLPGLLFDLLVELALVAERSWIAHKEAGYYSDVRHVQPGVGPLRQVYGLQVGQLGFFGAVGGQKDPRRE